MSRTGGPEHGDPDALASSLDRAYVFHSWSAQGALKPFVIAGGQGCRAWDHAGNRYLDFSSQLVNLNIGHQQAKIEPTMKQAERAYKDCLDTKPFWIQGEAKKLPSSSGERSTTLVAPASAPAD